VNATTTFTGPGVGPEVTARDGERVSYAVAGAFAGTVTLERLHGRCSWIPIVSVTVPATGAVVAQGTGSDLARFRLRLLAYLGGMVETALEVQPPAERRL